MDLRQAAIAVGMVLGLAGAAAAQEQPRGAPAVDVSRLPLDVDRIERELRQSSEAEDRDGLNLRYHVDVFGVRPPMQLFTREDNLATGPVPYGAPTHQQMVEHVTPREYRSPRMDLNALFLWLAEKAKK